MSNEKLEPCPFCGNNPIITLECKQDKIVECRNGLCANFGHKYLSKLWNTRPPQPQPVQERLYCKDPDSCTYSDCPTAFCDKDKPTPTDDERIRDTCEACAHECCDEIFVKYGVLPSSPAKVALARIILSYFTELAAPLRSEVDEFCKAIGLTTPPPDCSQSPQHKWYSQEHGSCAPEPVKFAIELKKERDSLRQQLEMANDAATKGEKGRMLGMAYEESQKESNELRQQIESLKQDGELFENTLKRISKFGQMKGEGFMEMEKRKFIQSPEAQLAEEALHTAIARAKRKEYYGI